LGVIKSNDCILTAEHWDCVPEPARVCYCRNC